MSSRYKQSFHIPSETIERCNGILEKYVNYKYTSYKIKVRDQLYNELYRYLQVWINSLLKKWDIYEDPNEILSLSWLAFVFCLDHYKHGYISFEKHFYTYTRYFLLDNCAKKENVHISLEELKDVLVQFPTPENQQFERLLTLYQFRDTISEKCLPIWDDAMSCFGDDGKCKYSIPPRFSKTAYYAIRKSFLNMIKLILCIKDNIRQEGKE